MRTLFILILTMAPPAPIPCSVPECPYITPTGVPTWDNVLALLGHHTQAVHPATPTQQSTSRLEKLPRPIFTLNMTESQWNFTKLQWDAYISQINAPSSTQLMQLQAACDTDLKQRVFDTGTYTSLTSTTLFLTKMKELAVITVHKSVHLMNLWKMSQQSDETIRAFAARVTSTADMCGMMVKCTCDLEVSYRDNVVQQLLIHGMRDTDIRVRVLSRNTNGEITTLAKLIDYIAAEEAGISQSSDLTSEHSSISGIRRQSHFQKNKGKCSHCGQPKHSPRNTPDDRKSSCKAWGKICDKCQKPNHYSSVCQSQPAKATPVLSTADASNEGTPAVAAVSGISGFIFSINSSNASEPESMMEQSESTMDTIWQSSPTLYPSSAGDLRPVIATMRGWGQGPVTTLPLPHHVHDTISGWLPMRPRDSPMIQIQYSVDRAAYADLNLPLPRLSAGHHPGRSTPTSSVCDTGAQLMVVPQSLMTNMQIKPDSIFPIQTRINGVSNAPVQVEGGILLRLTAKNSITGVVKTSHQLAYVSKYVNNPYLSLNACIDLGLIPANFPQVGSCEDSTIAVTGSIQSTTSPTKCSNSGVPAPNETTCSCPRRELPPTTPPVLPCAPTPENLPKLRQSILDRYASSSFNCCEHQPLKLMDKSPSMRVFTDENAKPSAIHTPSTVPLHWQEAVKQGLHRDEQLGVIERVPVNDPVTWCSRMVITAKSDGSPRRVVDYSPLNQHTPRQTHHTESPWSIVSSIPGGKIKSTLDCWHGYHSVPLHPADRHLTTFLTPWGRYRYRTVPQGLISAGDAYTQRKAEIMEGIADHKTCVDDSILFDDSIEENFYKVCRFLEVGALGGCTFNPKKFQFGLKEVNFLGFLVTEDGVKPTQEFTDSILHFPTPKTITDIRSWYGAINQISFSFASAPIMAPFRHLLSSKVPFHWTAELDTAFEASKQEVIRQCENGVRSFNPDLPTALATDWAKLGLGFWLTQKHCKCNTDSQPIPGCCPTGWQTVFCGSRFCSPAESRYHPIEGEALAAIHGLLKCKFFVLGLNNLILTLDHKPLIAIFGDKQSLEEIHNPRLLNFKLKAMMFRFKVLHVPGKKNVTADTFSRRYDSPIASQTTTPTANNTMDINIQPGYSNNLGPPTWVSPPTLAALTIASTDHNEELIPPEDLLVGNIFATLATVNSWSRMAPVTSEHKPTVLSWERLEAACHHCDTYQLLHKTVRSGTDQRENWDQRIIDFYQHRHSLVAVGPVVLLHDRPVIPQSLQQTVLEHLHAGHQSATSMFERASASLYWPNYRADMINFRAACRTCSRYQPSNPAMPPITPETPVYPFQSVCADFFTLDSHNFLTIVDRYSNWLSVFKLDRDTSEEFLKVLRTYVAIFGIPLSFTSDGAKVFTSKIVEDFFNRWGIVHRVTTAYNPRSNKRAEVAVKSAKRLIRDNLSQTGSLDTDKLARAVLQHRNTPCPITGISPAQIVFGRVLRDFLPLQPGKFIPRKEWQQAAESREKSYSKRILDKATQLSRGTKQLPPLQLGDHVYIQDQHGRTPKQWNNTGIIVEVGKYNDYHISVDGSRHVTKRNRQFLRKFVPTPDAWQPTSITPPQPTVPMVPLTPTTETPQPVAIQPELGLDPQLGQEVQPAHELLPTTHPRDDSPLSQTTHDHLPQVPQPIRERKLPPHLRERWILAKDLQQPAPNLPTQNQLSPVQYVLQPVLSPVTQPIQPINHFFPPPIQQPEQAALSSFQSYPFVRYLPSPYLPYTNLYPQNYSSYSTNQS